MIFFVQDVNFGVIDAKQGGLLKAIQLNLSDIFIPAVSKTSDWGLLSEKDGLPAKSKFLSSLENFVEILTGAQESLDDSIVLKECEYLDLSVYSSPSSYMAAASSIETVEIVEKQVKIWIKQIEQVIVNYVFFLKVAISRAKVYCGNKLFTIVF